MNPTLVKVMFALVPASIVLLASALMFVREKRTWSVLQLVGAGGMVIVVVAHLCEALQIFPGMRWGQEQSIGHYVDLSGGILGLALFPLGHLLHALAIQHISK